MKSFRHWTPRYVVNRIKLAGYEFTHPNAPWLTSQSIGLLEQLLKQTDVGLEFGCGRSTLWFAKRVAKLVSIEHDNTWHAKVSVKLQARQISNVTLLQRSLGDAIVSDNNDVATTSPYIAAIEDFADGALDFCLIDGRQRDICALRIIPKLRLGGVLIVDNSNVYLPSTSKSPNTHSAGATSEIWAQFLQQVINWRHICTSNGVWDTTIWIKR